MRRFTLYFDIISTYHVVCFYVFFWLTGDKYCIYHTSNVNHVGTMSFLSRRATIERDLAIGSVSVRLSVTRR